MLSFFANHPLFTAIGMAAFLCGVAVFHTVMMRTSNKRQAEADTQDASENPAG